MGREVVGRFKREGTNVYLWLIYVAVWQKLTQICYPPIKKKKKRRNNKRSSANFLKASAMK